MGRCPARPARPHRQPRGRRPDRREARSADRGRDAAAWEKFRFFEARDFDLWAAFRGDAAGERRSDRLARAFRRQLHDQIGKYEASGSRRDLERVLARYEGLIRYGPKEEEPALRRRMLPYYLKTFQFKKYSHWKRRIGCPTTGRTG
jgi:hypothetical protein